MTHIDKHIEKLIKMLQSPKPGTRYEACEYLRVAPSITPEALEALKNAIDDPDASVAEVAQRALNVHCPDAAPLQSAGLEAQADGSLLSIIDIMVAIAVFFALALALTFYKTFLGCPAMIGLIIIILSGITGSLISGKLNKPGRQGGCIGAIVGAFLAMVFFVWSVSNCGFCQ
jgi:hypothetical protein